MQKEVEVLLERLCYMQLSLTLYIIKMCGVGL